MLLHAEWEVGLLFSKDGITFIFRKEEPSKRRKIRVHAERHSVTSHKTLMFLFPGVVPVSVSVQRNYVLKVAWLIARINSNSCWHGTELYTVVHC
jgi:hypothetical protein